ncbi:hypothetical protein HEK616_36220 [Streptomyces nigrescens]|uniref:Transposase n=1 Tax=Streptomyces nigrescens TaxID=1920 RepID=A0ABM7ZUV0_STRNI|nr:hypothetical protein HEK616_36220 [Streptomyces nigrescens]
MAVVGKGGYQKLREIRASHLSVRPVRLEGAHRRSTRRVATAGQPKPAADRILPRVRLCRLPKRDREVLCRLAEFAPMIRCGAEITCTTPATCSSHVALVAPASDHTEPQEDR